MLAVFCGLAVVSQLFTLIVQWIHCIDDSFDREFSHMAGKVRQLAKHGRAASKNIAKHVPHMRCRHRDRSRDDHRHEKMMEKSKMVEPASDLLVLLRIRRQLLAAAYVAGGDDWYHVLQKIDANGDGKITRDELATWVRSVLPAAQAADKYITRSSTSPTTTRAATSPSRSSPGCWIPSRTTTTTTMRRTLRRQHQIHLKY